MWTQESDTYLFEDYSKRKLTCLSKTYEDLSLLYSKSFIDSDRGIDEERKDYLHKKQIIESKLVFAKQLKEISDAVYDVANTVVHVSAMTDHKKKLFIQYMKKQGVIVKDIVFIESNNERKRMSVIARLGTRESLPASDFAGMISVYFDKRMVVCYDSERELKKGFAVFLFDEEPRYNIISAMSRAVKENEKISGDNYSVEELSDENVYMMISDGMGSGEQACKDSQSVIEFMEKFLEAGFQSKKAFTMINSAIAATEQGINLTTLDICCVNLRNGEAEFIKAGAAPSFVKRGPKVDVVLSDTLPLGSFIETGTLSESIDLMDGDMIIMISDGVAECFENDSIINIISKYESHNPKEISDYLLTYAINCSQGRIRDDMTILVAGVWQNF